MTHFNKLTPAETERLSLLLEEMGEAQQAIGKILRHGYESHDPFDIANLTNRISLEKELGDVIHSIRRMCTSEDLSYTKILYWAEVKSRTVGRWLHHQEAIGENYRPS